jgi:hypothetical protein
MATLWYSKMRSDAILREDPRASLVVVPQGADPKDYVQQSWTREYRAHGAPLIPDSCREISGGNGRGRGGRGRGGRRGGKRGGNGGGMDVD